MTIEEKLRAYILIHYKSLRDFVNNSDVGLSYSTIDGMLKRGIGRASVHNVIALCKALNISTDELAQGKIVEIHKVSEPLEVENILNHVLQYHDIELDGKPLTKFELRLVEMALNMSVGMIKDNRH